jgi:subtilisin-like proprotein convertase family protein
MRVGSRARLARAVTASLLAVAAMAVVAAPAGAKTKQRVVTSGPIGAPIADHALNVYPLKAKGKGKVKRLTVGVRISHAYDSDLDLYLVSPRAKFVQLSTDNGRTGNDYGGGATDCTGTFTVFDDAAVTAINAGPPAAVPPFAGSFKPQQPLSAVKGVRTRGTWQLVVSDDDASVAGTLDCWQVTISSRVKKR